MNTANLQLEGVLMALAALCRLIKEKKLADAAEIEAALAEAERAVAEDDRRPEQLSASNVEAMLFPLRFLRESNRRDAQGSNAPYSDIATAVGRSHR